MGPRAALHRGLSTGAGLARGTADRVVRLAGPTLGRVAGSVVARVRGAEPPAAPASFTPAVRPARPTPEPGTAPSPAVVARNIGPQRPVAAPPRKRSAPKSAPGAKLPPPRPSPS